MRLRQCKRGSRFRSLAASFVACLAFTSLSAGGAVVVHGQPAGRTSASARGVGKIQGVAFDSLIGQPMSHATVTLLESGRTTVADAKGRFSFDTVAVGSQIVTMTSSEVDSLGLGTIGATAVVSAGQTTRVTVATSSLHTLWNYRCGASNRVGSDSGIVWGNVRDASSNKLLAGAHTTFNWYEVGLGQLRAAGFRQTHKESTSNGDGIYFACGLPSTLSISSEGITPNSASGRVEYVIGSRRLHRLDLLVSTDMVVSESDSLRARSDSALEDRARGRASVRGLVTDDQHKPLANAVVLVATADTSTRTGANGRFQLGGLPAGTHSVEVRRIGSPAASQVVQLHPDAVADVTIEMSGANALAIFNVRGKSSERVGMEARQEKGYSHVIDSTILNHRPDFMSALQNIPFVLFGRIGSGVRVVHGPCLQAFLDGLPVPLDMVTVLPPDHFRAIEVIRETERVPAIYDSSPCGVMMFWTYNKKW